MARKHTGEEMERLVVEGFVVVVLLRDVLFAMT